MYVVRPLVGEGPTRTVDHTQLLDSCELVENIDTAVQPIEKQQIWYRFWYRI